MRNKLYIICFSLLPFIGVCQQKIKDVSYLNNSTNNERNKLDIYIPKSGEKLPVFVFIHGGSWQSGSKNTFKVFGTRMSKRGHLTYIINYRLAPEVAIQEIIQDCSSALNYIKSSCNIYGGDSSKTTISGHSAGGHLAAMVATKAKVKNVILNDAFGLNMKSYFEAYNNNYSQSLLPLFGTTKNEWIKYSPHFSPPHCSTNYLVLVGGNSYDAIKSTSKLYYQNLKRNKISASYVEYKKKGHYAMAGMLFFPASPLFKDLLLFLETEH